MLYPHYQVALFTSFLYAFIPFKLDDFSRLQEILSATGVLNKTCN